MKINKTLANINKFRKGGFKFVAKYLFFYQRAPELKKKYNRIVVWCLIADESESPPLHAIFQISFFRKHSRSPAEYHQMIIGRTPSKTKAEKVRAKKFGRKNKELSYIEVINDRVLSSYNTRTGTEWSLKSIIGWTHGVSKFRSTELPRNYKTAKAKAKRGYASRRGR